jgi:hypothetical protein
MKLRTDLSPEDLESLKEIEEEILDREPSLWNISADIGFGLNFTDNINSVSKSRFKMESDTKAEFNSAKFDRTESGSLGLTATRPIGEESSLLLNLAHTTSNQYKEADDDFQSYGFTLGFDTTLGNQSLSPYLIANKSDSQHDADSFSYMYGIGGFFSVGERNSFSYGYSYSDSKANRNSEDDTAHETNTISHSYSLGYDLIITQIISSSLSLGYTDNDSVVDAGNDAETYDIGLVLNFAFPWAYISVGNSHSFNDYKKVDTSVTSSRIRSDYSMTSDIMITKALGDFFPALDPNRTLFMNLSYEKLISEANILNYDYIADSFAVSFTKSLNINK